MAETMIHTTKAIGPDHLIQLIKQLSKIEGTNRAVTVGLIGYPNVGKSSVINSLKRAKTCEVSSTPGSTKNLKEIKLDKEVKLLDCPGVIFEKDLTRNQLILQNTYRVHFYLFRLILIYSKLLKLFWKGFQRRSFWKHTRLKSLHQL